MEKYRQLRAEDARLRLDFGISPPVQSDWYQRLLGSSPPPRPISVESQRKRQARATALSAELHALEGRVRLPVVRLQDHGIHEEPLSVSDIKKQCFRIVDTPEGLAAFADDPAFERWYSKNGGPARKAAYYAQSNSILQNCLRSFNQPKEVNVVDTRQYKCKNGVQSLPRAYRLTRESDRIRISATINLYYHGYPKGEQASLERFHRIYPCVRDFYARQGIDLDLTFRIDPGLVARRGADFDVRLWDERRVSEPRDWIMLNRTGGIFEKNRIVTDHFACFVVAHELGHGFGLPDRTSTCEGEPRRGDDLMASVNFWQEQNRIYPEDLETIIGPLCSPNAVPRVPTAKLRDVAPSVPEDPAHLAD